jgi:UDP-N-acetylglucosamine 2-epimerase (non-hydrolysing)
MPQRTEAPAHPTSGGMKVILVAGARPNFMKVAPVLVALRRAGHAPVLVHTGQHYDARMSDAFFADLELPEPDHHLGVGSGSHAVQTARIMEAFEPVVLAERPDWVVVFGDVNSTLACALVAAKLQPETGCRVAHVEAGLRSGDWRMPEEVNRVVTDRVSDLLLTPSRDAHPNLRAEGVPDGRVVFVGNTMIDTLLARLPRARERAFAAELGLQRGRYAVSTLHRPSNVDDPAAFRGVLEALGTVAREMPVVLPLHPRARRQAEAFGLEGLLAPLKVLEPVGYLEMLSLTEGAAVVLTDSGGVQEETTALGVPCVTLREQTERPVTVTEGTNRLAPWPLTAEGVVGAFRDALARGAAGDAPPRPEGWDGRAGERVAAALAAALDGGLNGETQNAR